MGEKTEALLQVRLDRTAHGEGRVFETVFVVHSNHVFIFNTGTNNNVGKCDELESSGGVFLELYLSNIAQAHMHSLLFPGM